jgi:hypothetical protein
METISAALAQHLAGEVTTMATCWRITRRDGVVLGFTDDVRDLEVDGLTYEAASGYIRTAIRGTADLSVDNLEVESVFSDDGITEEDLRTGKYDFAEVRMFLVNYENLAQGILKLRRGWLGEVVIRDGMYVAELRGMTQKLQMAVSTRSRPTIMLIGAGIAPSATSALPTFQPSHSTVTRSPISATSSSRCEIQMIARPSAMSCADDLEQPAGLAIGQGRRRLVYDHDLGVEGEGPS